MKAALPPAFLGKDPLEMLEIGTGFEKHLLFPLLEEAHGQS